jgi:hypothetical protein
VPDRRERIAKDLGQLVAEGGVLRFTEAIRVRPEGQRQASEEALERVLETAAGSGENKKEGSSQTGAGKGL